MSARGGDLPEPGRAEPERECLRTLPAPALDEAGLDQPREHGSVRGGRRRGLELQAQDRPVRRLAGEGDGEVADPREVGLDQLIGPRAPFVVVAVGEDELEVEPARGDVDVPALVPVVQRQSYLSGIAYLAALSNEPGRAIPETEQAVEELRAANLPRLLLTPMHNLGDLRLRNEQLEGSEEAFREAMRREREQSRSEQG